MGKSAVTPCYRSKAHTVLRSWLRGMTAVSFLLVAYGQEHDSSEPRKCRWYGWSGNLTSTTNRQIGLWPPPTQIEDRLEVSLDMTQKNDPHAWCGKPALLGPAGILAIALTPNL